VALRDGISSPSGVVVAGALESVGERARCHAKPGRGRDGRECKITMQHAPRPEWTSSWPWSSVDQHWMLGLQSGRDSWLNCKAKRVGVMSEIGI